MATIPYPTANKLSEDGIPTEYRNSYAGNPSYVAGLDFNFNAQDPVEQAFDVAEKILEAKGYEEASLLEVLQLTQLLLQEHARIEEHRIASFQAAP